MAAFPANCPLGQTYFYDSGLSGVPSTYYAYSGDPVDIAAAYYETVHNDADPAPILLDGIILAPSSTALDMSINFYLRVVNPGAASVSNAEYRVFQAGGGMSGIVLASLVVDFTFGPLDVYFRTFDNAHTLLDSVTIATGVPNPFSVSYTGAIRILRIDGAVSTYYVYLNGVLVTTYTDGGLSGPIQIQHEVRYDKPFAGVFIESRLTAPYYVGAGLPQLCYGNRNDLIPHFIPGL